MPKTWIQNIEREQNIPNFWETLAREKSLFQEAKLVEDQSRFSPEDQKVVSRFTNEVKEYFKTTQKLRAEEMKFVADRLDYLEDAATRLGRKDWINLALGVLTNVVVAVMLAPNAVQEVFRFVGTLLKPILPGLPHVP